MINARIDDSWAIAKLLKEQLFKNNTLQDDISRGKMSTGLLWKNLDNEDIELPEIDLDISLSSLFGIYQIQQSKTYTEEHLDENGNYVIQVTP